MPGGTYAGNQGGSNIREAFLVNIANAWIDRQNILDCRSRGDKVLLSGVVLVGERHDFPFLFHPAVHLVHGRKKTYL